MSEIIYLYIFSFVVIVFCWCLCSVAVVKEHDACSVVKEHIMRVVKGHMMRVVIELGMVREVNGAW